MPLPQTTEPARTRDSEPARPPTAPSRCTDLVDRLGDGDTLPRADLTTLIASASATDREYTRHRAVAVAREHFGHRVFVRGLIEFSNHCRQDCLYCGIRKSNREVERYRLDPEQILDCCAQGYALGYRTFVLQSGEDARYTTAVVVDIVSRIRASYPDCAITLSVGERGRDAYQQFFDAGADRYLLRHETATADHYARLHPPGQALATRLRALRDLKEIGFQTGAGFMVGSPFQSPEHLAADLLLLGDLRPHMVGIGPFLPHRRTPFGAQPPGSVDLTLFMLSLVRLMLPTALMPSTTALGTARHGGREQGILAGANVLMLNLSPQSERSKYLLYDNKTTTGEVVEATDEVRRSLALIGYSMVVDRGDHPEVSR